MLVDIRVTGPATYKLYFPVVADNGNEPSNEGVLAYLISLPRFLDLPLRGR